MVLCNQDGNFTNKSHPWPQKANFIPVKLYRRAGGRGKYKVFFHQMKAQTDPK